MKKLDKKEMKRLIGLDKNVASTELLMITSNIRLDNTQELLLDAISEVTEGYNSYLYTDDNKTFHYTLNHSKNVLESAYKSKISILGSLKKNARLTDSLKRLRGYSIGLKRCGYIKEHLILEGEIKAMCNDATRFINTYVNDELGSLYDGLYALVRIYENSIEDKQEEVEENIIEVNFKLKKILCHKEMDKHLKENGFNPIRQTGSHLIYKNESKVTCVPQHSLGIGLSYAIQKQIS